MVLKELFCNRKNHHMMMLYYYLHLGMTSLSIVVAMIYVYYNLKKDFLKKILSVNFIFLSLGQIVGFMAMNDLFLLLPHVSRTGMLFVFLIAATTFIIIDKYLHKSSWKAKDLFHYIPALIYTINYLPYFLSSSSEKIAILKSHKIANYDEGFLPIFFIPLMAMGQIVFYSVYALILWKKDQVSAGKSLNVTFFGMLMFLLISLALPVLMAIFNFYDNHEIGHILPILYNISNLFIFYKFLMNPQWIFNTITSDEKAPNLSANKTTLARNLMAAQKSLKNKLLPKTDALKPDEIVLLKQINIYLSDSERFLSNTVNQKALSTAIGISKYKIRIVVEKAYDMNFTAYINHLRIQYLSDKYGTVERWKLYNINTIASELGYGSMNAFYMNFKKIIGTTPRDFFDQK
jgi:AraC-like DNA-binding protein